MVPAVAIGPYPYAAFCTVDCLLRVVVQGMSHYSHCTMGTLLQRPRVQDCKTGFALDRVPTTTAMPLCTAVQGPGRDKNVALHK